MSARILVVEDEEAIRLPLVDALQGEGFEVLEASDGERGLELALREDPDLVLLDLMLPKRDGLSCLRAMRADRMVAPVLILTARGEEWDRVQGFEHGADDYVVKPFSAREVVLRVRALLERARGGTPGLDEAMERARFGAVEVDFAGYAVVNAGARHRLSRTELALLRFLLENEGRVLRRDRLLEGVWGRGTRSTNRTVDTHVLKLRKKIEADPEAPQHLLTVRGVGYQFVRDPDAIG